MDINNRRFTRFNVKFFIFSNEIKGEGVNISKGGIGFFTTDELIPADSIPFKAEISSGVFGDNVYTIIGIGNLIFSKPSYETGVLSYYNGFEIIKLKENSKEILNDIIKILEDYELRR